MPSRKSNEIAPWAALALRLALGGYFAWSGWNKVFRIGLDEFTRAVGNYKIVYSPWDAVVAYTIPWVEMVVGACLILGLWKRGALWVLAGLVGMEPHELQFGGRLRIKDARAEWPEALAAQDRVMVDAYLGLPVVQRRLVRELVAVLARAGDSGD